MLRTIRIEDIVITPDRQRQEHPPEAAVELAESIRTKGLLHAPVLRLDSDTGRWVLVAGERRIRAMADVIDLGGTFQYDLATYPDEDGCIPFTSIGELDPVEAEEVELEENIQRENLTWQERAAATARILKLKSILAERRGEAAPTLADLTNVVQGSNLPSDDRGPATMATRQQLVVANYLDNPEVQKAPTLREAYKLVGKLETRAKREALAAKVGRVQTKTRHVILNQNAAEYLRGYSPESFDVILSDPPYGMGADTFGDSGGMTEGAHFYADDYESWSDLMNEVIPETFRITKPDAHMYLFCDFDRFHDLKERCERRGWKVFRTPLIWSKPHGARAPWPNKGPQRKYECILFAVKGEKKVTVMKGDVLEFGPDPQMDHPAQKPVALFRELLSRSVNPGDAVLDFCAGSGPIIPAGHELQCTVTALEIAPAAYAMCLERLEKLA